MKQLRTLVLSGNPDLTYTEVAELQKALPKCKIYHSANLTKEESAKIIEAAIRKALFIPSGELTQARLERVTNLRLHANKLTSVKGLEKLTKLEVLELNNNQLINVTGLEKLTKLRALDLSKNQLTDVTGLEKLIQLTHLYLADNQLTKLPEGMEKLTRLRELHLRGNSALTKPQVDELKKALPRCVIFSNFPLTMEESAKIIEAAIRKEIRKPTDDLTEADLEKVKYLHLKDKQLADVKGLEKLAKLEILNLEDNPDLTKVQIDELQKVLPKCRIYSNPKK